MTDTVNVITPKVYKLREIPPDAHQRMFIPAACLELGAKLWCHSSRRSSLGGYIGTFSEVWEDRGWIGAKGQTFTMLMDYVEPVQ